jgi:hypothetical protein
MNHDSTRLLGWHPVLGVRVEVAARVHRELREKVALVDLDPAEPVRPAHTLDAFNLTDTLGVGDRQREHQGDGVARDQASPRGRLGARVPSVHQSLQKAEGEHGHHDSQRSQRRTQLMAQAVTQDELEEYTE